MATVTLIEYNPNREDVEWSVGVEGTESARAVVVRDLEKSATDEMYNAVMSAWDTKAAKYDEFVISHDNGGGITIVKYQNW